MLRLGFEPRSSPREADRLHTDGLAEIRDWILLYRILACYSDSIDLGVYKIPSWLPGRQVRFAVLGNEPILEASLSEDIIELFSHCDHGTSRIVFAFVVGNYGDEAKAQRKEHLRSCTDAASDAHTPEAVVLE
ncbi:hypothetical protein SAMN05192561_10267 [Halopenitus malekzadehii]|uniref:Uncharacterized protein n=1 Tax=Halopenitus malekzadehii TaxID=1267564 RepID=A0A1H6IGY4_9EURY|nr:hypothetical protein SAMN05192561_10267 [Halopenitus malekzadehii]